MKAFYSSVLLLAIVVTSTFAKQSDDEAWEEYKKKHGKVHKDAQEEAKRKELFLNVHRQIEEHNNSNKSWKMGHNPLSDWTTEEKKQLAGRKSSANRAEISYEFLEQASSRQLPSSIDFRGDICLGAIKDQGQCGSCWAFSSIVPLEFQLCKYKQAYIALSEQQLVNCACSGCNGGDYYPAWQYLNKTSTGSVASTTLGYRAVKRACKTYSSGLIKPMTWARVPSDALSIMAALQKYGPLAVAMDVETSFFSYSSGVYDANDCFNTYSALNHAMALVGYGTDTVTGLDYWVIRNSWGTSWGIEGYMLVRKGVNRCGVEIDVAFVKTNMALGGGYGFYG